MTGQIVAAARKMAKIGVMLDPIGVAVAVFFALLWLPIAWGIDLGTFPP